MYCKTAYDPKSTNLKQERVNKCTTSFFHVEKENFHATAPIRMQENQNADCSVCPKCGQTSYAQRKAYTSLGDDWGGQVLKENYCTDCSGRNRSQNVRKMYVNEGQSGYPKIPVDAQDYVTVLNPRRTGRSTDSTRGSMYGCDMIYVEDVPLNEDVNKPKTCDSNKSKAENSRVHPSKPSSENSQGGNNHKISDISCSKNVRSSSMSNREPSAKDQSRKTDNEYQHRDTKCLGNCRSNNAFNGKTTSTSNSESKQSCIFLNNENSEINVGKGKTVDPEKLESETAGKNEIFGKCTGSEEAKSKLRKGKVKNHEAEYSKTDNKSESLQKEDIADKTKHSASLKTGIDDAKRARKNEIFQPKDTGNTNRQKTEENEVPKHGGHEKSKLPRGSKRRRAPRRTTAHVHHARDSEKQDNGGVAEWLRFVYDSIKTG